MFIFRPITITTCSDAWVLPDSVNLWSYGNPYYAPPEWVSGTTYIQGQTTSDRGYDFVSVTNSNTSRPSNNFVGRLPRSNDAVTSSGALSWIRKGYTNKYKCFVPQAAGFTESYQTTLNATIAMAANTTSDNLILLPIERVFLLCSGISGKSLTVSALEYGGSPIKDSPKTVMLPVLDNNTADLSLNPELLDAKSFLYPALAGLQSDTNTEITEHFRVELLPFESLNTTQITCFAENIVAGRLTRLGNLQWSNHTFNTLDRSKVTADAWGMMSMDKRRVSKAVNCEVILSTTTGGNIVDNLYDVYRLLAYLRGHVNGFIMTNQKIESSSDYTLTEINHADVIMGILKNFTLSNIYKDKALLSMTIESIPTGYRV